MKNTTCLPLALSLILLTLCLTGTGCFDQFWTQEKKITGTITVAEELKGKIGEKAALYVIARPAGQTSGPPVAVRRFGQPLAFPLEFQLLRQDMMTPEHPFEGELTVSARIAQEGAATPVIAGDLEGLADPSTVKVDGRSNDDLKVKILINRPVRVQN